ncbi:MAG: mannose-1-phosphate guanylyltransferase [Candidatus Marinimicrobia bacterium]|jgi:mannose-1-phosphate guanylyltransferase|nr:mannose-1-phosphate guanylyltransferase [Candidatus Neomarinimicrobiota bacterium]
MYAVIIAGGIGKRFWPRSRRERPKQLLNIVSEQSMLKLTYERLRQICDEKKIYVIAGPSLKEPILRDLTELPEKNVIIEPSGKDTAPAIGLATTIILDRDPNAVIGIFPSDHFISDINAFKHSVQSGYQFAKDHVALVTFGITPNRPATGYGYIQMEKSVAPVDEDVYKVKTFAEKPLLRTAIRFLESGEFLWNSGMFIWKGSSIINAIKLFLPELHDSLQEIAKAIGTPNYDSILKNQWATLRGISIDYGVMEKAKNVYVVAGNFDWSDVGSWDAVYDLMPKDENENVLIGDITAIESSGCYVYSRKNMIATIGVKDLIVIQSKDSILIVHRNESEKVKDLVDLLDREKRSEHL